MENIFLVSYQKETSRPIIPTSFYKDNFEMNLFIRIFKLCFQFTEDIFVIKVPLSIS